MPVKVTDLRANLYQLLDRVLQTGEVLEVNRNGRILRILPAVPRKKIERLTPHSGDIVGDPDDLVHLDWSGEWRR